MQKLKNLTELILDQSFNQRIKYPCNLKFLTINNNNVNLLNYLPNSLERITFGPNFNSEIVYLPNSIKELRFKKFPNYFIFLPNLLKIIELPCYGSLICGDIPQNCKIKCKKIIKPINYFDII